MAAIAQTVFDRTFGTRYAIPLLAILAILCGNLSAAGPGKQNDFHGHRVLIIGIDGCRRDVMQAVIKDGTAPSFQKLSAQGRAYWNMEAGGEPTGKHNQPTISGPGWSTILTGVFADKHLVLGNDKKFAGGNFKDYPHFFKHIRYEKPTAWLGSIVGNTWPEVNTILVANSGDKLADLVVNTTPIMVRDGNAMRTLTDGTVEEDAARCLEKDNPDVLFLHFLDTDHAGHQFGFSPAIPEYVSTLRKLDGYVGDLLKVMHARPEYKDESWLIVVVTDHGGIKKSHGGQSPQERQIFAFFNAPGIEPAEIRSDRTYQTIVTPTVLNFLGMPIDPKWGLEAEAVKANLKISP